MALPDGTTGRVAGINDKSGGWTLAAGMEHVQLHASFPTVVLLDQGGKKSVSRDSLVVLCNVCDNMANSVCGKCKDQSYCGRDCQAADWKKHKKLCGK